MSLGNIMQHTHHYIQQHGTAKVVDDLLLTILEHTDKTLIVMIDDLMRQTEVAEKDRLARCTPILLQYAAIHLADDIADDDCDYIDQPFSIGTTLLCILQNLAFSSTLNLTIDTTRLNDVRTAFNLMTTVGYSQYEELMTTTWTLDKAITVANQLTGEQIAAYFYIALLNTPHSQHAHQWGNAFGVIAHIANDIKYYDKRFTDLDRQEKEQLKDYAFSKVTLIAQTNMTCLNAYISPFIRYIN